MPSNTGAAPAADLAALLAHTRFASEIAKAESLTGDERRAAMRTLATGFFNKRIKQYIELGGPIAEELAAHLPANDTAPKQVAVRDLDLRPGTEPSPMKKCREMQAQAAARDETPKPPPPGVTTQQAATKEPKEFLEPEVKANKRTAKALSDAIATWRSDMGLANQLAAEIGASQTAGTVSELEAEGLIEALHKKTGITKKTIKVRVAKARPTINPEWTAWNDEQLRNSSRGDGYDFLIGTDYGVLNGYVNEAVKYGPKTVYQPICRAFRATHLAHDQDSGDWALIIEFEDHAGVTKEERIGLGELQRDSSSLRERLSRAGLNIIPGADAEKMFGKIVENVKDRVVCYTKAGWHGRRLFASPNNEVVGDEEGAVSARIIASARWGKQQNAGTFEKWYETSEALIGYGDNFAFAAGAAYAGVVATLMEEETNRGGLYTGDGGGGKTSALKLPASAWGSPEIGIGAFQSFRGTVSGFEGVALKANDSFLAVDEAKNAKDGDFSLLIFMLAAGAEKLRKNVKNELRDTRTFKLFFLMSSERTAKQITDSAGEDFLAGLARRLVDIRLIKSDSHDKDMDAVKALVKALNQHWGFAGPRFVRYLIDSGLSEDRDAIAKKLEAATLLLMKDVTTPGMKDASTFFAYVHVCADIAEEAGLMSAASRQRCQEAVMTYWRRFLGTTEAQALAPSKSAVEGFKLAVVSKMKTRALPIGAELDEELKKSGGATLFWYDDKRIVIPRRHLAEFHPGVTQDAFLKELRKDGCLIPYPEKNGERVKKMSFWPARPTDWGPFEALVIDREKMGFGRLSVADETVEAEGEVLTDGEDDT
jgi:hypothetical protein